ncbi:MAG: hypothetical protein LBJ67_04535 [Planctomycetaceae bacterium]|jgi:hypothetical protein|nr:hypothetical protein [Planctomycetaceae bacterium]
MYDRIISAHEKRALVVCRQPSFAKSINDDKTTPDFSDVATLSLVDSNLAIWVERLST